MTLILGLVSKQCVAVASDGFSRLTRADKTSIIERYDLQKVFPLGPRMALVHHGVNKIGGQPIEGVFSELGKVLPADLPAARVEEDLTAMFGRAAQLLEQEFCRFNTSFGIWLASFDEQPRLVDLHWKSGGRFNRREYAVGEIALGGDGAKHAREALAASRLRAAEIGALSATDARRVVRDLYNRALPRQGTAQVFGGKYRSWCIDSQGCREV